MAAPTTAGSSRPIEVSRDVGASAEHLWSVISTAGYLEKCHPFCEANPVERWPGTGAVDTIHYYGGRVVERHFTAWEERVGYDLEVTTPNGIEQAQVRWRIGSDGGDTSRLAVTLLPRFLDHLPRPMRRPLYPLVRRPMERYLESVLSGVVHFAETGRQVTRNQFGPHRWFSPKSDPVLPKRS